MPERCLPVRGDRLRARWRMAAVAAAVSLWGAQAGAATYTWVGGNSGDPSNYNDSANWSPNTVPGSADIAYFNAAASNQPTLTSSTSLGELDFNTNGWMLGGPSYVLTLDGVGGAGILSAATSGINEVGTGLDIGAAQTWQVATGGTLQIDGVISDSNALTIGAAGYGGTVILTNANTYSGALTVNAGMLELAGTTIGGTPQFGQLQSVTSITLNGGTFEVNNTSAAGGNQNNRINPAATLNLGGGSFVYLGSNTTTSAGSVGAIYLNSGPTSVFTVTANDGAGSATVTASSIIDNANSISTSPAYTGSLLVNGVNLGTTGGSLLLTTAPSLSNGTPGTSADMPGTYNTQIVPFLLGEVSGGTNGAPAGSGSGGTAFGTPNTFLTYNSTTGLRPLNPLDEFAPSITDGSNGSTSTVGDNIYLQSNATAAITASTNPSINSLVINGAATGTTPILTIPDSTILTDASGALLFVTSGGIHPSSSTGTFDFGSTNLVNITVLSGNTATISTPVTGTGSSMTVSGGGSLLLTANDTFSNAVTANASSVTFGSGATGGWNPANPFAGDALVVAANGSATFNGSSTITSSGTSGYYTLNLISGGVKVNGTLNLATAASGDSTYISLGANTTFTNAGTTNVSGNAFLVPSLTSTLILAPSSTFNIGGTLTANLSTVSGYVPNIDLENGALLNVGSPTNSAAAFNINATSTTLPSIMNPTGGAGYLNVYGTLSLNLGQFRLGADYAGADIMTVYSGGIASLAGLLIADNKNETTNVGLSGILGAVYLNSGSSLYITTPTGVGSGTFSIGASGGGNGTATGSTPANGINNNFGYVSVGPNAFIGPNNGTLAAPVTTNAPGTIDIGGNHDDSTGVGGGNGLLDINGGTVTVNEYVYLSRSSNDQQFGQLDILNGGTLTTTPGHTGASIIQLSAGPFGSSSVINVVNSTLNVAVTNSTTNTNDAINLAGSTGNTSALATALPTGILNINGTSIVRTGYVRAGDIYFTPATGPALEGEATSIINFNGGKLQYDGNAATQSTFVNNAVGGIYVYSGGAIVGAGGAVVTPAPTSNVTANVGFFAPPGTGLQSVTVTSGGSGYLTPPVVYITDSTGFDATGYATINSSGQVTGVTVTNPGFNLTNATVTFVGGGGTGAAASTTLNASNTSGGLTVQDTGTTFTLAGTYAGTTAGTTELYSFTGAGAVAPSATSSGSGSGNNPYAAGYYYGAAQPGVRNNTSTYTGPTVIESGTLALSNAASAAISAPNSQPALYEAGAFPAVNNNIPFSPVIVVGDTGPTSTPNDSAAVFNVSKIGGAGGFELSPGLTNGSYVSTPQVLGGFGTVVGSSTVSVTVGLASGTVTGTAGTSSKLTATGNDFGGYAFANGTTSAPSANHSVLSAGYTSSGSALVNMSNSGQYQSANPNYGTIVAGTTLGGTSTVTFDTQQGNALSGPATATGALTIGGGTSTTLSLGAGGTYYWKLDLSNGGAGLTNNPGTAQVAPSSSGFSGTSGAPVAGEAWDEVILDAVSVNSTIGASTSSGTSSNAFTVQGVAFTSGTSVTGGSAVSMNGSSLGTTSYSWTIARISQTYSASTAQPLLASLSFNTAGLPAPASGYQYFLSAQQDPFSTSDTDLVVNYAPVPEPEALLLLAPAVGALMLRRRRGTVVTKKIG